MLSARRARVIIALHMRGMSSGAKLLVSALLCLVGCALAVGVAIRQPWLGLGLAAGPDDSVVVTSAEGPAAAAPVGARLVAIEAGEARVPVSAGDLIEDPDAIDAFDDMRAFFARQSLLASSVRGASSLVLAHEGRISRIPVRPAPTRPLSSLPFVFWFQLFAGSTGLLMGVWVWVLRPRDIAAAFFAAMGVMFPAFTIPAAIYSTRELALDGGLFAALSKANLVGACLFGCALVGLFLSYPKRLVPPRALLAIPAVFGTWTLLALFELVPDQNTGSRLIVVSEMLLALVLGLVQAWATRGDARDRAALRWLGLSVLLGSGLFVFTSIAPRLFGWFPPLRQGYAFGFFLLMDVGLALGLRRVRLFELDEWAFRVLVWVGGALLLLALDGAALYLLNLDEASSLAFALVVSGFAYLPLRGLLWSRLVAKRELDQSALFQGLLEVSFGVSDADRSARWVALLQRCFEPLVIEPAPVDSPRACLSEEGAALLLPSVASTPALRVAHPWRGRALFGPRHARLADSLVSTLRQAEESRGAYDRGAREERARIARDLHDDVGARLLTGLEAQELERAQDAMRHAMSDMRSIVSALTGEAIPLADLLGDLRHEAHERLSAARIALDWPVEPLDAKVAHKVGRHLVSMLRELISNVIRHAGAARVTVDIALDAGSLTAILRDDGAGIAEAREGGYGLDNLRRRAAEAGGELRIGRGPGAGIEIRLPILEASS